jgi:hypothetical protein
MKSIEKEYEWICKIFFPAWDREKKWKLRVCRDLGGADGKVDKKQNRILIRKGLLGQKDLTIVLIHEIAHALTTASHKKMWSRRMKAAAYVALCHKFGKIVDVINEELKNYQVSIGMVDIYGYIESAVIESDAVPSFDSVINATRVEVAMSKKEFLKCFPRSRTIYLKAKDERERGDRLREALLKRVDT